MSCNVVSGASEGRVEFQAALILTWVRCAPRNVSSFSTNSSITADASVLFMASVVNEPLGYKSLLGYE